MLDPIFEIRVTHSGLYADGRPNITSVLIDDLDFGFEHQNRKVPVYVPPDGSIDIPLTSNSLFSVNQGAISKLVEAGLVTVDLIAPGAGGGSASVSVVDQNSTAAFENGSWDFPWKTIQRAINAWYGDPDDPSPAPPTAPQQRRTTYVVAGEYDEDLVFPAAGAVELVSVGIVTIGSFTSPRTLTRVVDPTKNLDAPFVPGLLLSGVGGIGVFGPTTFADVGAGQIQNIVAEGGGGFFNNFDGSGQTARLNLATDGILFLSPTWNAPTAVLNCRNTSFYGGAPNFDYFLGCRHCNFTAGLSFAQDPNNVVLLDTLVNGTVTTPSNFRVDFFTNGIMAANVVGKAGGWTNTIPIGQVAPY